MISRPNAAMGTNSGFQERVISWSTHCLASQRIVRIKAPVWSTKIDQDSTDPNARGPNISNPKVPYSTMAPKRADRSCGVVSFFLLSELMNLSHFPVDCFYEDFLLMWKSPIQ